MDIACAPDVLTMNMTHTGELGYVFYIPNEFAIHVYDSIMEEGKKFGLKHCGYYAQRAVRIEKFYAYWGQVRCPHLFLPEWKIWQKILEYDCRTSTATPLQWNVAEPSDVK